MKTSAKVLSVNPGRSSLGVLNPEATIAFAARLARAIAPSPLKEIEAVDMERYEADAAAMKQAEAAAEVAAEEQATPRKRGFFARLFRRNKPAAGISHTAYHKS